MYFFRKMNEMGFVAMPNVVNTSRWQKSIARPDGVIVHVLVTASKKHTRFTVDYVIPGIKTKELLRKLVVTSHTDLRVDSDDSDFIARRDEFFSDLQHEPMNVLNDQEYIEWLRKLNA